jgi:hypothetical protein
VHHVGRRLLHVGDGHLGHALGPSALGRHIVQTKVERLVLVVTVFLSVLSLDASVQEEEDESSDDEGNTVMDTLGGRMEQSMAGLTLRRHR